MRVSTMQMHNTLSGSMQKAQGNVSKTLLQMSSGKEILKPSDDPFASVQLLKLDDHLSKLETWSGNIDKATTFLGNQESALMDMNNNLDRTRDLVLSAGNGALSLEDRKAIAKEIEQTVSTLKSLANTKGAGDEYIFGGTAGQQEPVQKVPVIDEKGNPVLDADGNPVEEWSFEGSESVREVQVSDSQHATLGSTASDLFFQGDKDFFTQMDEFVAILNKDPLAEGELEGAIDAAIKGIDATSGAVNEGLTDIGAEINMLEEAKDTNTDLVATNKAMQSSLEALDYAEAIPRLTIEQTVLTATQKGYASSSTLTLFNYI
ncbi:flagellar hook-associated protein FlgL [Parendozoicomonas haliclonae]|uniref:Flagellar hook-associated protein 3 n=1 Tax=Parendozoicomonas haliclonae TaxID=1960125 RepID=A0A1X7AMX8_9GAMM|nr:flagellar hook-associated protein FlgL [Parendozoicomonas haliclonae]SMA49661.1 Flagellar hook-associated protein 3 [Parendozoicomonas haliclonae]